MYCVITGLTYHHTCWQAVVAELASHEGDIVEGASNKVHHTHVTVLETDSYEKAVLRLQRLDDFQRFAGEGSKVVSLDIGASGYIVLSFRNCF